MARRRLRRRSEKVRHHATSKPAEAQAEVVREATRVERLAYTRTQAADALGVSRSTFNRRVLPLIETVEMPWGTKLVPVDELERLIADQRRPARAPVAAAKRGRPAVLSPDVIDHIHADRRAGMTLRQIANSLNARRIPTAHGGTQWWASTVRSILRRYESESSDMTLGGGGRRAAR